MPPTCEEIIELPLCRNFKVNTRSAQLPLGNGNNAKMALGQTEPERLGSELGQGMWKRDSKLRIANSVPTGAR